MNQVQVNNKKTIIIFIGASGAGKTTLGCYLRDVLNIPETVSHTTRRPRNGETPGVSYHFINKTEFDKIEKAEFTEYPPDSGNFYCLSVDEINRRFKQNNIIFAVTEINGVRQIKQKYGDMVKVIFINAPKDSLPKRMQNRGDSAEKIKERLNNAEKTNEFGNIKYADYVINNIDLEESKANLRLIIEALKNGITSETDMSMLQ